AIASSNRAGSSRISIAVVIRGLAFKSLYRLHSSPAVLGDVKATVRKVAALGDDPLSQLLHFFEPGPRIFRFDRLHAEANPLIVRQLHLLQRLEDAILVDRVNLGCHTLTSIGILSPDVEGHRRVATPEVHRRACR